MLHSTAGTLHASQYSRHLHTSQYSSATPNYFRVKFILKYRYPSLDFFDNLDILIHVGWILSFLSCSSYMKDACSDIIKYNNIAIILLKIYFNYCCTGCYSKCRSNQQATGLIITQSTVSSVVRIHHITGHSKDTVWKCKAFLHNCRKCFHNTSSILE